jgi:HSP20 family protein
MALTPWEPFEGLTPLRDAISRLLEESIIGPRVFGLFGRTFPVDIRETETAYLLEAALPGMKPEQLQVTATANTVTIRATKREEKTEKAGTVVRQERYEGELLRAITLPGPITRDQISAAYEHGMLMLRIPKTVETQGTSVTIQVTEGEGAH